MSLGSSITVFKYTKGPRSLQVKTCLGTGQVCKPQSNLLHAEIVGTNSTVSGSVLKPSLPFV